MSKFDKMIKSILVLLILIIGIMSSGCIANGDNKNIEIETEYTYKIVKIDAEWTKRYNEHKYTITYFDEKNISRQEEIWAAGNYDYNTTIIISNESKLIIKHTPNQEYTKEYVIYSNENELIE